MTTTSKENKILNAQGDKNITKKDLMKVFWRSFTMEWSWNYERQSNMSYTYAMIPIINKMLKNCGIIFSKDFQAFFSARCVLSLSLTKDKHNKQLTKI